MVVWSVFIFTIKPSKTENNVSYNGKLVCFCEYLKEFSSLVWDKLSALLKNDCVSLLYFWESLLKSTSKYKNIFITE